MSYLINNSFIFPKSTAAIPLITYRWYFGFKIYFDIAHNSYPSCTTFLYQWTRNICLWYLVIPSRNHGIWIQFTWLKYRFMLKMEMLAGLLFKAVNVMKASQVAEINDIASSKLWAPIKHIFRVYEKKCHYFSCNISCNIRIYCWTNARWQT